MQTDGPPFLLSVCCSSRPVFAWPPFCLALFQACGPRSSFGLTLFQTCSRVAAFQSDDFQTDGPACSFGLWLPDLRSCGHLPVRLGLTDGPRSFGLRFLQTCTRVSVVQSCTFWTCYSEEKATRYLDVVGGSVDTASESGGEYGVGSSLMACQTVARHSCLLTATDSFQQRQS